MDILKIVIGLIGGFSLAVPWAMKIKAALKESMDLLKETQEFVAAVRTALDDDKLTLGEARYILDEADDIPLALADLFDVIRRKEPVKGKEAT